MAPRWSRSNPLALAVLVSLYEKPMHPYEVAQTLRARAKQDSVRLNYGSLYAVVESLEKKGFIKATGTLREGRRPQRTVYAITEEGSVEMTDWLTELLGTPTKEYPAFMAGLSFIAALSPEDAEAALRRRADALRLRVLTMRGAMKAALEAGLPRIFELEAEYEERLLTAELDYTKALLEELSSGSLAGLDLWRGFHSGAFDPEEVRFNFELPSDDEPGIHEAGNDEASNLEQLTRGHVLQYTSPVHEGPTPESSNSKRRRPPVGRTQRRTNTQAKEVACTHSSRPTASPNGSARSRPCPNSLSPCRRASRWPSSVPTAPARPPSSAWWPRSSIPTTARSGSAAMTWCATRWPSAG
jgi:DNA-binding PadR family transcriptional regulator